MTVSSKSYIEENGITKEFLLSLTFKVMSEMELYGFLGCESENPMIAYTEDEKCVVVLDGYYVEVIDAETGDPLESGTIEPSEFEINILTANVSA
jgi:hypothetical protein